MTPLKSRRMLLPTTPMMAIGKKTLRRALLSLLGRLCRSEGRAA